MSETTQSGVSKVLISIIIIILLFALIGGAAFLIMNQRGNAGQFALKPEIGPTASLGEFTVNLADNKSFVRATIVLELDNKKVIKELNERDAQIKHNVISTLRLTKPEQMAEEQGLDSLCFRVQQSVNNLLNTGVVVNVYFTQLVIQ